jgi:hypothetical protein
MRPVRPLNSAAKANGNYAARTHADFYPRPAKQRVRLGGFGQNLGFRSRGGVKHGSFGGNGCSGFGLAGNVDRVGNLDSGIVNRFVGCFGGVDAGGGRVSSCVILRTNGFVGNGRSNRGVNGLGDRIADGYIGFFLSVGWPGKGYI